MRKFAILFSCLILTSCATDWYSTESEYTSHQPSTHYSNPYYHSNAEIERARIWAEENARIAAENRRLQHQRDLRAQQARLRQENLNRLYQSLRLENGRRYAQIQAERNRREQERRTAIESQRQVLEHATRQEQANLNHHNQEMIGRQALEEARRRSFETARQEAMRREQLRLEEERQIAEARRRSMETYRQEQQRRFGGNVVASQPTSVPQINEVLRDEDVRVSGITLRNIYNNLGRAPSQEEMIQELSSRHGFNRAKAMQIIDELGM